MTKTIQATYEGGVFRPSEPVSIAEGSRVELTVREDVATRPARPHSQSFVDALAQIAALPPEGAPDDGFSGADHDKVLYGGADAR